MAEKRELDWRLLALIWGLVAAVFIARTLFNGSTTPLIADTDDAMRLVVVRDFLTGQGWYDNVQHRLNTPFGAELHWSRLADLPLAGLILGFRPFAGSFAETLAAWVLPLLYLVGLLYLSARIALKLAGPEAVLPALVLPAVSLTVLNEFVPGRVDHHSLQILLLLAILWCAIEALTRPRFAVGAGLAAATAIAIGIEGLPSIAAAVLAFGLMWVTVPARADALRWFGLSFALGTVAHLVIGVSPARWLAPMCDAISIAYAAAAVGTGVAFVVLSLLPVGPTSLWVRLALGVAAATVLALGFGLAFPDCLRGPYAALDPWLVSHWIDRIREAQPWWVSLMRDPVYPMAIAVPAFLGLVATGIRITRGERAGRGEWLIYSAFLVLAVAIMVLQIRGSRMATCVAVPACAWVIVAARHHYLARRSLANLAALVLSWIASSGLGVALLVGAIVLALPDYAAATADPTSGSRQQCIMPAAFGDLAARPPARIMAPVDLGSHLLAFTPHAVVGAPYHRNQHGVRATFDFFNAPIADARTILAERGVTLVVICPAMPEVRGLADAAPDSFARLYAAKQLPAWLALVSAPGAALEVYEVRPN